MYFQCPSFIRNLASYDTSMLAYTGLEQFPLTNTFLGPKTISALENDPLHCSIESLLRLLSALDLEFLLQGKEDAPQGNMWE